ncbi:transporter substrate-binding domain-containing protein [Pseudomonas sp. W2Oct36]|uniref:substrate-binding periplasmic protein n=1 Tax=unclassified Pseudomonas TaxID=196821 RepID=UPI00122163C6|nr:MULTISPECIES: transporter substrate-binding domain-containing protein [unclassified Pseudomonas]MBD8600190.1 transporter substrate-binding domain-containing protein [Pseudomonas sp. CFBP 8772]RZI73216.1 MAG: transporter substrate-binding domain-containing protein [Pseudomonas sp.]
MPPIFPLSVAVLLACLSFSALGEQLRIVTEPWSPYVIVDGNHASGLDYDTTAIVFERLGIDVEWQFLPWKRCLMMLSEGEADGVLDINKDEARVDLLYPDEPLSSIDWVLFQANARPHAFNSMEDLRGLTIGVSPGYRYIPAFDTSTAFIREPAPSHEANFGKLIRGRIDLMVTDRLLGRQMIERLKLQGQVSQLPTVLNHRGQYLALRRNAGMDLLAQRFSAELKRFKREPAYAKLVERYTGETPTTLPAESEERVDKTVEQQESSAL